MDARTLLDLLISAREHAPLSDISLVIDGGTQIESVELVFTDEGAMSCINLVTE